MKYQKQGGFSLLAILISIVAIAVVMTAVISAGSKSGGNPMTATQSNKMRASGVMDQANAIGIAFTTATANGVSLGSVTFDTTASTGVFNSAVTGAEKPSPNAELVSDTTNGVWHYKKANATLNGVGTSAADYAVVLPYVKQDVCAQINTVQRGSATIPAAGVAVADFTTDATAVDLSGVAAVANWSSGCVATSDGTPAYVYFHTVSAQ